MAIRNGITSGIKLVMREEGIRVDLDKAEYLKSNLKH